MRSDGYDRPSRKGTAMSQDYYIDPDPKPDPKLQAMLADPEAYFAQARVEAEIEAKQYVRREVERREAERVARRPTGWRRLFRTA